MGTSVEELILQVKAETASAQASMGQLNKELNKVTDQKPKQESFLKTLQSNWLAVAGGVMAAYQSLKVAFDFIGNSVSAAAAQEKVLNGMAAAMHNVGKYSDEAFAQNIKFAESLSKIAGVADDDIEKMQTLFIRFGAHGDQLNELTQATLDFAAATGKDLSSAADTVARAIQGDNENLGRYKIGIEGASNSTERMTSIAKGMATIFGGAASSDTATFDGKLRRLKVSSEELQETFGTALAQSLKKPLDEMLKFSQSQEAIDGAAKAGKALAVVFVVLKAGVMNALAPVRAIGVIGQAAFVVLESYGKPVIETFNKIKDMVVGVINQFVNLGLVKSIISGVKDSAELLGTTLVGDSDKAKEAFNILKTGFQDIGKDVVNVNGEIVQSAMDMFSKNEMALKMYVESSKKSGSEIVDIWKFTDEEIKEIKLAALSELLSINNNFFSEIESRRDDELNAQLERIDSEKNIKIASLDEAMNAELANENLTEEEKDFIRNKYAKLKLDSNSKYSKEEKRLKSAAWEQDKAAAIVQASIDASLSFVKSLASAGVPLGIVLGGIAVAAAGVQIGLIASRRNPYNAADGGIINEPVHGIGASGRRYTFGENGSEIISPTNNYGGASIVIQNMTIGSKDSADDFIFQLEKRTGSRLFRR